VNPRNIWAKPSQRFLNDARESNGFGDAPRSTVFAFENSNIVLEGENGALGRVADVFAFKNNVAALEGEVVGDARDSFTCESTPQSDALAEPRLNSGYISAGGSAPTFLPTLLPHAPQDLSHHGAYDTNAGIQPRAVPNVLPAQQLPTIKPYSCSVTDCNGSFLRKGDLTRHRKEKHGHGICFLCPVDMCPYSVAGEGFVRNSRLTDHLKAKHKMTPKEAAFEAAKHNKPNAKKRSESTS